MSDPTKLPRYASDIAMGSSIGLASSKALGFHDSVARLMANELDRSLASAKLAFSDPMTQQTLRMISAGHGASASSRLLDVAGSINQSYSTQFKPVPGVHMTFEAMSALANSPHDRALEAVRKLASAVDGSALRGVGDKITGGVFDLDKSLSAGSSLSHAAREAFDLNRADISALSRSLHWSDALAVRSSSELSALWGNSDVLRLQLDKINEAASTLARFNNLHDQRNRGSLSIGDLYQTSTKMALFAGGLDVLGPGSAGSAAAFGSLLGDYHTSADLGPKFWRDPIERTRVYRDHDVDAGLINAENAEIVSVLVESGVVEGRQNRSGTISAVVEIGPVCMEIFASRPKLSAFSAIDHFEGELRAFVAAKLESAHGPQWFKHFVPGDVADRAKSRRHAAMRDGETKVDLIHFVDLGDFIPIVTNKTNWTKIFGPIFENADYFKVDLGRLNAIRRPTAHGRKIDGVQLCEVILVIRRLTSWMLLNGSWSVGWDDDV